VLYYLHAFGYRNCHVTTVFHQYMSAFPGDTAKAEDLIRNSSITATLAGATRMMVKTAAEALKIPDQFDNSRALGLCRQGIVESSLRSVNAAQVRTEKKILKLEVTQIMHAIMELGNRQIATGVLKAIEQGIIDVPWSPNIYNKSQVTAIRDVSGAIRFSDFGNLPFSSPVKEFHEEKVFIRKTAERKYDTFSLLEEDLSRIWKCDYRAWPLDDNYLDVEPAKKNGKIVL